MHHPIVLSGTRHRLYAAVDFRENLSNEKPKNNATSVCDQQR